MRHSALLIAAAAALVFVLAGCPSSTCIDDGNCYSPNADSGPEGSSGDGGGSDAPVDAPEGCDPAADPKDAPKCVVSEYGVFVDASGGDDGNAGTKDKPVKSIGAAIAKAGNKPRVYVCEGTYEEHVKVTSALSLFGGFSCGSWSYSGAKAKVTPKDKGYALELRGASSPVVVADLAFTAREGVDAGESSVGAFVVSSSKVTFRRASIEAGKGVGGLDGSDVADFAAPAPDGNGGGAGGLAKSNPDCATSIGGAGGKAGSTSGAAGEVAIVPVYPTVPLSNGLGGSAAAMDCGAGSSGRNGSYGNAGSAGAGAPSIGTLDANGWKGTDGSAGGKGGDAQGGGGGAQIIGGGTGGSGGPGGCGGAGGPKGTAGGSSIALLVFESTVALDQTTLTAKDAGRGGNGAKGQKGQMRGAKGIATNGGADACDGGLGGIGGSGGGGGGGAGGISAGILYKGTAPKVDGAEKSSADQLSGVTTGKGGAAGTKGAGGEAAQTSAPVSRAGLDGSDGKPGDAKAVMSAP